MVLPDLRPMTGRKAAARHGQQNPSSKSLTPNMRRLFHWAWRQGFGTLRGVHFCEGDPRFDPPFQTIRKARTTEKCWLHPDPVGGDFTLKREHIRFIEELAATGSGFVDIKIVNGLPVELDIYEPC